MTISEIKQAVNKGKKVYWANIGYTVINGLTYSITIWRE